MKVVFIGKLPTKAVEGLKAHNIDVVFLATTVADAIDWISVNGDFEAVVLIQKGLNKDQDSEKQIFALQEIMGAMHSTARLLIFLTSKELYDSVKSKNIIKYSPSYLSHNDTLMLSQVYQVLHNPELEETMTGVVERQVGQAVSAVSDEQSEALSEVAEEPQETSEAHQDQNSNDADGKTVESAVNDAVAETEIVNDNSQGMVEENIVSEQSVEVEESSYPVAEEVIEEHPSTEIEEPVVDETEELLPEDNSSSFDPIYTEPTESFEQIYTEPVKESHEEVTVATESPQVENVEERTKRLLTNPPVEESFDEIYTGDPVHSDFESEVAKEMDMDLDQEPEKVDFFTLGRVEEEPPEVDEELERAKEELSKQVEEEVYKEIERVEKLNKFQPPVNCYAGDNKKVIVVLSLFSDAGSSFIANNMAVLLGRANKTVSVVEYLGNKGTLYSYLNGPAMEPDNWRSIASRVEDGTSVNGRDYWRDGTISWFPKSNKDGIIEVTEEKMINYMTATNVSEFTFVDISTNWEDPALRKVVYDKCHEIWVVFKPNVAKLVEPLMHFKEEMGRWSDKIQFIGNGFDSYTKEKEVLDQIDYLISNSKEFVENPQSFGGGRDYYLWKDHNVNATIPQLSASVVSRAEWKGFMVAQTEEGRSLAKGALMVLLNKVCPQGVNAIPEKKQRNKIFGRIFKKAN